MKQKVLKLLLPIAIFALAISGCTPAQPTSEGSGGGQDSSGQVTNSYLIKFVNDDGTVLQEGQVDEGVMPEYTGATPTKAATAQYTYTFDKWDPEIVVAVADATYTATYTSTVNRYTVTFDTLGGTNIDAQTVEYGQTATRPTRDPVKEREGDSFFDFQYWELGGQEYDFATPVTANITLTAHYEVTEYSEPTIVVDGQKTLSINAGESVTLPGVTATDFAGNTLDVEFEDEFGGSTIQNGQFTSKIAGAHNIIYYTEDDFGGSATETVTVTVVPAHEENFPVSAAENTPANITTYGTYKENFAKGKNSPFYKSLVDGREASEISATSDAIAGNSLVFNARLLLGNASYCLFGKVINDVVLRDVQVTYTISFDYKAINSDGCFNGMYFSPSFDTDAGSQGKDTKLSPVVGEVVHFEETYSRFVFPSTTQNCYLRFFNYNASNPNVDSFIAIDNLVITAKEEAQITYVTPTTEQLLAEGGFTWNMSAASPDISNTSFEAINDVENATAKAAMQASDLFGENVIHLVGQADHLMHSLNGNNVISGKILEISFWYYAIDDLDHIIFMGCNGGNQTISGDNKVSETIDGNIKKVTAKLLLSSYAGVDVVNFYGGSASDEIFIGKITARLYDYIPPQEVIEKPDAHVPTTAELAAGYTWDMVNNFLDFDNSEYIDVANMEDATIKAAIQGNSDFGANVLRFNGGLMGLGIGSANLTPGYTLTVDIDYYCIDDGFQYFILRGATDADNVTQPGSSWSRTTISGNFKRFHYEGQLPNSLRDTTMTTYNGNCNILIGKVTISCSEPVPPELSFENHVATAAELAAGFTWIPGNENAHPGFDSGCETLDVSKLDNAAAKSALQGVSAQYVQHIVPDGGNSKFQGLNSSNVPNGKVLTVEIYYYAVTDFNHFLYNGNGAGSRETISGSLIKWSITLSPTSAFDYISIYQGGEGYIYKVTALLEDISIPDDETPSGHKGNDVIKMYESGTEFLEGPSKAGYTTSDYDGGIENLSSLEGMGTAPKKVSIEDANYIIIMSQNNQTKIEAGYTYTLTAYVYINDWAGAIFFTNGTSEFWNVNSPATPGYHVLTAEFTAAAACNYFSLYTNSPGSGSFYLGDVTVQLHPFVTPNGHKVGDKIEMYESGTEFLEGPSRAGYTTSDYDGGIENLSSLEGMGTAPKKVSIEDANYIIIMSQNNQTKIEAGYTYTLTAYVYINDWAGAIFFTNGTSEFWNVNSPATPGYHVLTAEFTAAAACNYFSLYTNSPGSGSFYLGNVNVEVLSM